MKMKVSKPKEKQYENVLKWETMAVLHFVGNGFGDHKKDLTVPLKKYYYVKYYFSSSENF